MNALNTVCCPSVPLPTTCFTSPTSAAHPWQALPGIAMAAGLRQQARQLWQAWRLRSRQRAQVQACWTSLAGLSDHALRDIGCAERGPQRDPARSLFDHERGLW